MVADGLNNRLHAGVTDAEALASHAAEVSLAARRTVEGDVANNHVLLGAKGGAAGRVDDELAAGEAFAAVVVGIAF